MDKDVRFVIGGGVLLSLGIILFSIGFSTIKNIEANDVLGIPVSEFLMTLSTDIRNTYLLSQIAEISGIIFIIIGMILMVSGIIFPDEKEISKSPPVSHDEAQKILRTRYAKGEVSKEQYEQMKKDLE